MRSRGGRGERTLLHAYYTHTQAAAALSLRVREGAPTKKWPAEGEVAAAGPQPAAESVALSAFLFEPSSSSDFSSAFFCCSFPTIFLHSRHGRFGWLANQAIREFHVIMVLAVASSSAAAIVATRSPQ